MTWLPKDLLVKEDPFIHLPLESLSLSTQTRFSAKESFVKTIKSQKVFPFFWRFNASLIAGAISNKAGVAHGLTVELPHPLQ